MVKTQNSDWCKTLQLTLHHIGVNSLQSLHPVYTNIPYLYVRVIMGKNKSFYYLDDFFNGKKI